MSLPDGEDWLLQPVMEGLCRYESLLNGTLDLADIALLNDAIAVKHENEARVQAHMERERK